MSKLEWAAQPASTVKPSRIANAPHTAPVVLGQDITAKTATLSIDATKT
jgi:hypothetical protein